MKTLIFSSLAIVGLLLVGLQHQQLRELRRENAALQQSSAEANQLRADLAKSSFDQSQDDDEIARLQEENHELLKLRNEVNQLRETRAQFEKLNAENKRLVAQTKVSANNQPRPSVQPVSIRINNMVNRGWGSPEDTLQTFFWAQRERNNDAFQHSVTPKSWKNFRDYLDDDSWQNFRNYVSIDIVARRDMNTASVQLGIQMQEAFSPQSYDSFRHVVIPARQGATRKLIVTLVLQDGEWRVDAWN